MEFTIEEFLEELNGLTEEEIEAKISALDEDSQAAFLAYLDEEIEEEVEITNDDIIAFGPPAMIDAAASDDTKAVAEIFNDIMVAKISDFLEGAEERIAESLFNSSDELDEITEEEIDEIVDSLTEEDKDNLITKYNLDNGELTSDEKGEVLKEVLRTTFNEESDFLDEFSPLNESAEHGDHESAFSDLSHSARQLENYTKSGFMRNELTKEDKKEIMGHHKLATAQLDKASASLGDRDSMNALNQAAIHLTDGHNVYHAARRTDYRTPGTTSGMAASTIPR